MAILIDLRSTGSALRNPDQACFFSIGAGDHPFHEPDHGALIFARTLFRDPAAQVKRDHSRSRDPFPVIFTGDMDMGTCAFAALAGGMSKEISRLHLTTLESFVLGSQMQIQHHPSGIRVAIAVKIKFYQSGFAAGDQARSYRGSPAACDLTPAGRAWRREIQGSPGISLSPAGMWASREGPGFAALEGQGHHRLAKASGDMRR